MGTYLLAGYFLWANRHLPGFWLIGLGGLLNFLAIASNGGTMPASASALATAGLLHEAGGEFVNSTTLGNPNLAFLGDIFATPAWIPFANVFSLGDVCIVLGARPSGCTGSAARVWSHRGKGEFAALLHERSFMRVWASQAASNLGDFAYSLVVLVSLTERGFGPKILATLLIVQVAPAAVTGLLGAPLVDRFSRKRLMIGADLLRAAAVGSLLLASSPRPLPTSTWWQPASARSGHSFSRALQRHFQISYRAGGWLRRTRLSPPRSTSRSWPAPCSAACSRLTSAPPLPS